MVACHRQYPPLRESRGSDLIAPRPPSVASASELATRPVHEFGPWPFDEIRQPARSGPLFRTSEAVVDGELPERQKANSRTSLTALAP